MKIRITSTPPGEAPEHIRQAWVGLEIPVPQRYAGQQRAMGLGVLSGPKTWLGALLAVITGRAQQRNGYIVEANTAVELLAARAPEAADWWRKNTPHLIAPGRYFMFAVEACEEVEESVQVEWLIPWHPVDDPVVRRSLLAELKRELPDGHVLTGAHLTVIGRRQDCDDVLFGLEDGRVAIVHLTYSGKRERTPDYPRTRIFASLDRFVEEEMKPAHSDWE
ncbi:MAG: hypothetical protein WEC15_04380 [Flavobacteriales bacterium]